MVSALAISPAPFYLEIEYLEIKIYCQGEERKHFFGLEKSDGRHRPGPGETPYDQWQWAAGAGGARMKPLNASARRNTSRWCAPSRSWSAAWMSRPTP